MHILSFDLFESVFSHNDLEKLADTILNYCATKSEQIIIETLKLDEYVVHDDVSTLALLSWVKTDKLDKKLFSDDLKLFLNELPLYVIFHKRTEGTPKGDFLAERSRIRVFLREDVFDKFKEDMIKLFSDENRNNGTYGIWHKVYNLIATSRDTLIHELQHAWDFWKSKGKYIDKNLNKVNQQNLSKDGEMDKYLKLKHEISARYTQTLSLVKNFMTEGFHFFFFKFKENFLGWNLLEATQKERIAKRLSQYYHEIISKIPSKDITGKIWKLESESEEKGIDLTLNYSHENRTIEIQRLICNDSEQEIEILNKIIYLADVYRKIVYVAPAKGYTCLNKKEFITILKQNKFKSNSGSRRDFRFKETEYIRYPKRQYKEIKNV